MKVSSLYSALLPDVEWQVSKVCHKIIIEKIKSTFATFLKNY